MERELVAWLREKLPQNGHVLLGPGDDAAILEPPPDQKLVVTTDMLMDGVDFHWHEHDPRLIGRKALAVNLSDLAAMAATPLAAFVSLAIPKTFQLEPVKELYEGLIALAEEFNIAIAGGDTNSWNAPLCISLTAIGSVDPDRTLRRDSAKVGDEILVTGKLGGSIRGKHFRFTPRIHEAIGLASDFGVRCAMDISDGLSLDLARLCEESKCGAMLNLPSIPISEDAEAMSSNALDHALSDGEDFELLFTAPPAVAQRLVAEQPLAVLITSIGRITSEPALRAIREDGSQFILEPRGYEH